MPALSNDSLAVGGITHGLGMIIIHNIVLTYFLNIRVKTLPSQLLESVVKARDRKMKLGQLFYSVDRGGE